MQATILLVEDEPAQRDVLEYNLAAAGYRVIAAASAEAAERAVAEEVPDLVVLDWMLPGVSGIELCRRLKRARATSALPVLMLSARGEEADLVRGLETGADDYVAKPYSVAELLARIRALLRRFRPATAEAVLVLDDLELDAATRKVTRAGTELRLGPVEYRLLATLMERPGRVFSRPELLDRVWGRDSDTESRTVDVHVGRLRRALAAAGKGPGPLRTHRGAGYSIG